MRHWKCVYMYGKATEFGTVPRGGAMGGCKGAKAPLKISKKGKMKRYDVFSGIKVIKLAFLSSLTRKYMLWKGFCHNFSTKKASALPPGSPRFLRPPKDLPWCCPWPYRISLYSVSADAIRIVHEWWQKLTLFSLSVLCCDMGWGEGEGNVDCKIMLWMLTNWMLRMIVWWYVIWNWLKT